MSPDNDYGASMSRFKTAGALCIAAALAAGCTDEPTRPRVPLKPSAQVAAAASRIAFVSYRDGNSEIYVMNADGSEQTRLTDNPASDVGPRWPPRRRADRVHEQPGWCRRDLRHERRWLGANAHRELGGGPPARLVA